MFDGHGGVDAAIYAANHLHVNLVRQEMFSQDPKEALCHSFKLTDERFIQKASREVSSYPTNTVRHQDAHISPFCIDNECIRISGTENALWQHRGRDLSEGSHAVCGLAG